MNMLDHLYLPKTIYKTNSKFNGDISVIEEGKIRRIKVGGVTQSINWDAAIVKKMYWGKCINILKEHAPDTKSILILGMGGGTLSHLLSHEFPGIFIASVELDSEIVDIAKNYFDVDSIPNHHIYVHDALSLIANPDTVGLKKHSFDAMVVDIYIGHEYPALGATGTFLNGVMDILRPGGVVIFNRLNLAEYQQDIEVFKAHVEEIFDEVVAEAAPGRDSQTNMLIFGKKPE